MPGISGLEASRRILAHDAAARILVFSVHENEVMLGRALDMGIKGYISSAVLPGSWSMRCARWRPARCTSARK